MLTWPFRPEEERIMAFVLPDARQLSDDMPEALRVRAVRGCELGFTEADSTPIAPRTWAFQPRCGPGGRCSS